MGLTLLTAPAEEPISLAEAKLHLHVDENDEDTLISALIVTAREAAEARTGRALISQTWRYTAEIWPDAGIIELPRPNLISVQAISYLDFAGVRQTLAADDCQVVTDGLLGTVLPAYGTGWPACRITTGSIRIDYTAGYGAAAAVPQSIKAWMLLALATWYAQREALVSGLSIAELPRAFWVGLLDPYLIHQF